MDAPTALACFAALSNPLRLRVLRHLVEAGPNGLTAGEIATAIGASPSATSFHLTAMTDTGLIAAQRQSRHILYRADMATIGGLIRYLVEDCCRNDPALRGCCSGAG